jgi:hypothetical protein
MVTTLMGYKRQRRSPLLHRLVGLMAFLGVLVVVGASWFSSQAAVSPVFAQTLPAISFPSGGSTIEGESVGTISVQVLISQAPTATATVRYITFAGTAGSSDYVVGGTGTLTFPTGSTTAQTISVQIIDDTIPEPTENFRLFIYEPVNARIVEPDEFTINITDNDAAPTSTPTGGPPIFADALEPNNSFAEASSVDAGATARCNLTLYPPGDEDFFQWWGQAGITYIISTSDLSAGLDTYLRVYNTNQQQIGENDDESPGSRNSSFEFTASTNGFYFARVINTVPGELVNRTYCFEVAREVAPTLTPPPGFPTGTDECEFNSTIEYACLIVSGVTYSMSFVPSVGSEQDTDIYRLWMKPGVLYTCETTIPTGSPADTNIILWDANGNPFNPWIGNDDKALGNLGSLVSYRSTYTGWLNIVVGPVNVPPYDEAAQWIYSLLCSETVATPTPTPTNTAVPAPIPPGGGTIFTPTPIPTLVYPTPFPTPTPINPADFIPTPAPPPMVTVQPLPTATSVSGGGQTVSIQVTIFFDANNNFLPELTEGIMGVDVALFDNATGDLLSYGQTNEAGIIHFQGIQAAGTVRIIVPYLNYNQIITQATDEVLIRVAPGTLPIGIP